MIWDDETRIYTILCNPFNIIQHLCDIFVFLGLAKMLEPGWSSYPFNTSDFRQMIGRWISKPKSSHERWKECIHKLRNRLLRSCADSEEVWDQRKQSKAVKSHQPKVRKHPFCLTRSAFCPRKRRQRNDWCCNWCCNSCTLGKPGKRLEWEIGRKHTAPTPSPSAWQSKDPYCQCLQPPPHHEWII